jgi:hypothetical protein
VPKSMHRFLGGLTASQEKLNEKRIEQFKGEVLIKFGQGYI